VDLNPGRGGGLGCAMGIPRDTRKTPHHHSAVRCGWMAENPTSQSDIPPRARVEQCSPSHRSTFQRVGSDVQESRSKEHHGEGRVRIPSIARLYCNEPFLVDRTPTRKRSALHQSEAKKKPTTPHRRASPKPTIPKRQDELHRTLRLQAWHTCARSVSMHRERNWKDYVQRDATCTTLPCEMVAVLTRLKMMATYRSREMLVHERLAARAWRRVVHGCCIAINLFLFPSAFAGGIDLFKVF